MFFAGYKRGFDDDFSGSGFLNPSPVQEFFGLPYQNGECFMLTYGYV